jgi:hypothetical protein
LAGIITDTNVMDMVITTITDTATEITSIRIPRKITI